MVGFFVGGWGFIGLSNPRVFIQLNQRPRGDLG